MRDPRENTAISGRFATKSDRKHKNLILRSHAGTQRQLSTTSREDQQLHELGDVLAWLASLANQLGLSLDGAAARYRDNPPL